MTKKKEYKCWYKYCKTHKVLDNEAIKIGNKRYHKECLNNQENLKKCREMYIQYLQPSVVYLQLNKAIKTLIEDKKISVEMLLFTIEYLIDNNIEVNSPYFLYYKVNDYKIIKAFNEQNIKQKGLQIYS